MSPSIREQHLQSLARRLVSIASAQGAMLLRSPTIPLIREQSPALLLFFLGPIPFRNGTMNG